MFLKSFLMFSCLILYTASRPTSEKSKYTIAIDVMKDIIPKMNCSNSFIQKINFTRINNLCTTRQDTFCQISKALNDSSCTEITMRQLPEYLHHILGNATCTLVDNGVRTNMEEFLKNLESYLASVSGC